MDANHLSWRWGPLHEVVLQGVILKVSEKRYIAHEVASGHQENISFRMKYNLNKRTINSYKTKYQRNIRMREEGGRPPCVDEDAQEVIIQALRQNPDMTEFQLRSLIRTKHKESWQKWH